jgi:hypothetical protein
MPSVDGGPLASEETLPLASSSAGGRVASGLFSENTLPLAASPPGGRTAVAIGGEFNTPDEGAPVVEFFPLDGATLAPAGQVVVEVTDATSGEIGGLRRVVIVVSYDDGGTAEIVYDGDEFVGIFRARCTVTPIADGLRFVLERNGPGWLEGFDLLVFAVDVGGNEPSGDTTAHYLVPSGIGTPGRTEVFRTYPEVTRSNP